MYKSISSKFGKICIWFLHYTGIWSTSKDFIWFKILKNDINLAYFQYFRLYAYFRNSYLPLQRLLWIEYWQIFVKLTAFFALPYYLYLDFLDFGKFEIIWFGCSCDWDIWKKLYLQIVEDKFLKLILFVWLIRVWKCQALVTANILKRHLAYQYPIPNYFHS